MNIYFALSEDQIIPFVEAAEERQLIQEATAEWKRSQKSVAETKSTFTRNLALTTAGVGVLGVCYWGTKELLPFQRRNIKETSNPGTLWKDDKRDTLYYPKDWQLIFYRLGNDKLIDFQWTIARGEDVYASATYNFRVSTPNFLVSQYNFESRGALVWRTLEQKMGDTEGNLKAEILSDFLERILNGKSEFGAYIPVGAYILEGKTSGGNLSDDEVTKFFELDIKNFTPSWFSLIQWGSSTCRFEENGKFFKKTLNYAEKNIEYILCFDSVETPGPRRYFIQKKVLPMANDSSVQSEWGNSNSCSHSSPTPIVRPENANLNPEAQEFVPRNASRLDIKPKSWPDEAATILLDALKDKKFQTVHLTDKEMNAASDEQRQSLADNFGEIFEVIRTTRCGYVGPSCKGNLSKAVLVEKLFELCLNSQIENKFSCPASKIELRDSLMKNDGDFQSVRVETDGGQTTVFINSIPTWLLRKESDILFLSRFVPPIPYDGIIG